MTAIPSPWKVTVLTLYPEVFPGTLGVSILGKGLQDHRWDLQVVNIRDFALDKHHLIVY